ncbi:MAG: amino acid racemase [Oscillospiraceae bacterium]|nr:amino acid racemase [Oscillospiraceae bacterium]
MNATKTRKTLGVIGGMGPLATCLFYQRIIQRTDALRDQDHIPMIIFSHCTMPDRTEAILNGREETVYSLLLEDARKLEREGAGAIAIPCNTSHYFADRLQDQLSVPIVNMVRETVRAMKERGARKVGVLGTDGTIQTGLYQKECKDLGLFSVIPSPETQKAVMYMIYKEIKKGRSGSPVLFAGIDRELREAGCDGAILACTELSCFGAEERLPEEFYVDAMDVLVERSIEACGGRLKGGR